MNREVAASFDHCRQMSRAAASNFYYALRLLPRDRRDGMLALYAFARHCDDLSDSGEDKPLRSARLNDWRTLVEAAVVRGESLSSVACDRSGDERGWRILPALCATVERYHVPTIHLLEIVDGVMMDLQPPCYETFEHLCQYSYRVASAVGLACLPIWGCHEAAAEPLAIDCGHAFQMTNILRDVHEDAVDGRVYLPREELAQFGVSPEQLRRGTADDNLRDLLRFQIARTETLYERAEGLDNFLPPESRRVFRLMYATYRQLLANIAASGDGVLQRRVTLTRWQKLRLLGGAVFSRRRGGDAATHETPRQLTHPECSSGR
ncbi:MAG: squalene/phytoene synthase family protein [Planctomycetales bacterium]|nr:squalene/phytoene synthase family protein [Planctomycetales bacterium]